MRRIKTMAEHAKTNPVTSQRPAPLHPGKLVGAIVLPTATGKTCLLRSGLPDWVKEADDICHTRETYLLSEFRDSAKLTGNWRDYDDALGARLRERANDGDVILLASADLARAGGLIHLGTCALKKQLWDANVRARGRSPSEYDRCYYSALDEECNISDSYDELLEAVESILAVWKTQYSAMRFELSHTDESRLNFLESIAELTRLL